MPAQRKKTRNFFLCSIICIKAGESQMKRSDKGMKVLGVVVILAIIVSVFDGALLAEDLSGDLTQSVAVLRFKLR
jgi:hypothetical protein